MMPLPIKHTLPNVHEWRKGMLSPLVRVQGDLILSESLVPGESSVFLRLSESMWATNSKQHAAISIGLTANAQKEVEKDNLISTLLSVCGHTDISVVVDGFVERVNSVDWLRGRLESNRAPMLESGQLLPVLVHIARIGVVATPIIGAIQWLPPLHSLCAAPCSTAPLAPPAVAPLPFHLSPASLASLCATIAEQQAREQRLAEEAKPKKTANGNENVPLPHCLCLFYHSSLLFPRSLSLPLSLPSLPLPCL